MKRFLKTFSCFMFLICISLGFAFLPAPQKAFASSYGIKDRNVRYNSVRKEIVINENKVINITEYINVTYIKPGINLGLSRNISHLNLVTRIVDGKKYTVQTVSELNLKSVTMDGEPEYNFVEATNDYYYINTGADGDYKYGTHEYAIEYEYDMGEDFINDFDDFTFDVMDYGFRGAVAKFEAIVKLPKDFLNGKALDNKILSFRTNNMQLIGHEAVNLEFDEDKCTFKMSFNNLPSETGITMQLILDQGYFNTSYEVGSRYKTGYIISFACLIAIILIVIISRYGKKLVKPVEIMPPEGASVMDIASAYRGKIKSSDFACLMIDWAHKGLVEIEIKSKRHVILHKKRNITRDDTPNKDEIDYFNALFRNNINTFDSKKERCNSNSKLYTAVQNIYDVDDGQKKYVFLLRLFIHVLAIIPMILYSVWRNGTGVPYILPIFVVLLFSEIAICVFLYTPIPIWFKLIWCSGFGGAPLGIFMARTVIYDIWNFAWIAFAIYLGGSFLAKFIRVFSKKQLEIRGRVLGFKNFLIRVETNRHKLMLEDNPEYFFDILPYCYIFGITNKMKKKFSALNVPEPVYASGNGYVSGTAFTSLCIASHSTGASRSSSGGGSSGGGGGGGSSGGGGGGGGCGGR